MVHKRWAPDAEYTIRRKRSRRSFWREHERTAYISDSYQAPRVTVHELVHGLEYESPELHKAAKAFRARRTAGEAKVKLKSLQPNHRYDSWEVTKPDDFFDPYVGKFYGHDATEILTMGFERMAEDPIEFMAEDPDHFEFILWIIRARVRPNP